MKEATGDNSRVGKLRELCGDDFLLWSGDDSTGADFVMKGGDGVISVTANVAPKKMAAIMAAALRKDGGAVEELNGPLAALNGELFCQPNPIPAKYVMSRLGGGLNLMDKWARPPLHELETQFEKTVENAMRQGGLL